MYTVRVRIGDIRNEFETSVDFATLYRAGRSLVKGGKHFGWRVVVVISDWRTCKTLVRLYSMESKRAANNGKWIAAQSAVGKYRTHIEF